MELQKPPMFASNSFPSLSACNFLRVQLLDGSQREMTNPELGRDFISGVLENDRTRGFIRRSFIRSVEFDTLADENLSSLSFTRKTVGELLQSLDFPVQLCFWYRDQSSSFRKARVLEVTRGFMVTDYFQNPAIPLAAINVIEAGCE